MYMLVVYDTQFGNTEQVARAIGKGLERAGLVRIASVSDARNIDLQGVDLLVVGGPTQGHRARTPLRSWVEDVAPTAPPEMSIAVFDTRLSWPAILAGSAANSLAHILQRNHLRTAVPPESFIVTKSEGPLAEGELERATAWAESLATKIRATTPVGAHTG